MGEAKRNPPCADVWWVSLRSTHPTFLSAGRGLQPRPQCFVSPWQHKFRTGLQTPSGNLSRNVLSVHGSISFGRGCKPRPAINKFRTGLQTPSGNK